ncbi:MAG: hypothetical protein HY347_10610 [candidate division NC10 bacterium]|nr:hypothetical protein [candidate division NC10 bacterium]
MQKGEYHIGILDTFRKKEPPAELTELWRQAIIDLLQALDYEKGKSWWVAEKGKKITFRKGSVKTSIDCVTLDEIPYVRFLASIVYLPTENLLPFYRHLLEENYNICGSVFFGVEHDVVYICAKCPLESMTSIAA